MDADGGQNDAVRSRPAEVRDPANPRRLVTLRRVVISPLLAFAGALPYVAVTLTEDSGTGRQPRVVRTVSPRPGSSQLRQTEVFAELDSAYQGGLVINGRTIPDDQLRIIQGLNRISFTPGEGREIETFPAGLNCVVVRYRPITAETGSTGSYRWCFSAH